MMYFYTTENTTFGFLNPLVFQDFFGRKKRNTQEKSTSSHRSLIFIYPTQNSCHFHKLKAIEIALFAAHGYAFRSISYHPI
ncbi:hypothetical protein L2E82_15927 [Cichorium intybus]|uniref:Uncharacterized protein n=1 Tax=Cichorium intybus TaxID=13427 RepID=A0ACB9F5B1_CICIN|nr:hypothetical protein L2E82_15927 [Cichorium intybus]